MNDVSILERIISEEGSCCWASATICAICPLGRSVRYDKVGYMSCVEALNIDGLNEEAADKIYKMAALNKLADLTIEKVIEEN